MPGTDHPAGTAHAAAQWLLAEYDATDNPFGDFDHDGPGVHWHGLYVQPIFQLKPAMSSGAEMRVTASDYRDPCRWWL
jgi:hypothetical protein